MTMASIIGCTRGRFGARCAKLIPSPIGKIFKGIKTLLRNMGYQDALKTDAAKEFRTGAPVGEDNWKSRQKFCANLADTLEAHGKKDVPPNYADAIEPFLNNMLDCVISERTALSIQACRAVGDLPLALGKDIHPFLDRIIPVLIRHCASTKAVAQKSASAAVINIITHATYNGRLLWHVCQAFEDKYSGPKLYAPSWLRLILTKHYTALHPDRDFDAITHAITAGLEEADNNVRVNSRAAFWEYHKIDPAGADNIAAKLNAHARTALMNDGNNPDKKTVKGKSKKQPDTDPALAAIRQQGKERMKERIKQKVQETSRVVSASTILTEDLRFGPLDMDEDQQPSVHGKKTPAASSTSSDAPSSRPFLSAPVRRPRIVATPINTSQSSSRPSSRIGQSQPHAANDLPLRLATSHRELKPNTSGKNTNESQRAQSTNKKTPHSELSTPVLIPEGKENATIYTTASKAVVRQQHSPVVKADDLIVKPKPLPPQVIIKCGDDGLTVDQRLEQQMREYQKRAFPEVNPKLVKLLQEDPDSEMQQAYPALNHNGQVDNAQRAFKKALEYLQRDALDLLGFRKLRKLVEEFRGNLIVDQEDYSQLFDGLLPRLGTFDELLAKKDQSPSHENHPRYIRSAILTMISYLICDYPVDWSYPYQGAALASAMIARCAYSPLYDPHDGAPYYNDMTIVNQIKRTIEALTTTCANPVAAIDCILPILSAAEDFLMKSAPYDSEHQNSATWASYNPYSKAHRLQNEKLEGLFHSKRTNQDSTASEAEVESLPKKLPQLMETGISIIRSLMLRAAMQCVKLGNDKEDALAELGAHLLAKYDAIIRRSVVEFFRVLYLQFDNEERFWGRFNDNTQRNLLLYYLEKER